MIKEIRYDIQKQEIEKLDGAVIFLAGPTVRGNQTHLQPSWRFSAIEEFKKQNFNGFLIIPEFISPIESDKHRVELPIWEFTGLKRANCILFWVPRTRELIGLTTNHELGYWMGREIKKLVYGRPDDAYRIDYCDTMWKEVHYEHFLEPVIYSTLKETIKASIENANR